MSRSHVLGLLTDARAQGNLSDQQPVTIFDPIHDTVRVALEQRYSLKQWVGSVLLTEAVDERSIPRQNIVLFSPVPGI